MNEICSASPFSDTIKEEEIYPTLPDGLNGALDASRVKTYLKNSMWEHPKVCVNLQTDVR